MYPHNRSTLMTHNIGIVSDLSDIFDPSFVAAVSLAFLFGVRLLFPPPGRSISYLCQPPHPASAKAVRTSWLPYRAMLSILTTATASVPSKATHPRFRHSAEAVKAVSNPIQLNILDRLLCLKLVVTLESPYWHQSTRQRS